MTTGRQLLLPLLMVLHMALWHVTMGADILINEIMVDPVDSPNFRGQWIELFNAGTVAQDLRNWVIEESLGGITGRTASVRINTATNNLVIQPNGFVVLGNNNDRKLNGNVTVNFNYLNQFPLQFGGRISLFSPDGVEQDRVDYSTAFNFTNQVQGISLSLKNPALDNSIGTNWCKAGKFYNTQDRGTPGQPNACVVQAEADGTIIINEIMVEPTAVTSATGEWFELFNSGTVEQDLLDWIIDESVGGSQTASLTIKTSVVVPPKGFVVLGSNDDRKLNGNVTVNFNYKNQFPLLRSGRISLLNFDGVEHDRVEYNELKGFPSQRGSSFALSNPALDNNNGLNWCLPLVKYNALDFGSPGKANDCPPIPPTVLKPVTVAPRSIPPANVRTRAPILVVAVPPSPQGRAPVAPAPSKPSDPTSPTTTAAAPVAAPVASSLPAPLSSPVAAPVASPVKAPVASPAAAPVASPMKAPAASPVTSPVTTPTAPAPTAADPSAPNNVCSNPTNQCQRSGLFRSNGTRVHYNFLGLCFDRCNKGSLTIALSIGWKCGACP